MEKTFKVYGRFCGTLENWEVTGVETFDEAAEKVKIMHEDICEDLESELEIHLVQDVTTYHHYKVFGPKSYGGSLPRY